MPELPEMETYRSLLSNELVGRTIRDAVITREKSINVPVNVFIANVSNQTITEISRRAKHLLFHLESGQTLLLHLMLDGWIFYGTADEKPERTVQVELVFEDRSLYFIGLRLGYLHLLNPADLQARLAGFGPEPFDPRLDEERFHHLLKRRKTVLKPALVDQKVLAGIGNCYADEFCFHAGVLPHRRIGDLTMEESMRLLNSMRFILNDAMRHGGYMEFPLYKGDTLTGGYNDHCRVYDRGGEPCFQCGQPIVQEELASRKVFYCRQCQH